MCIGGLSRALPVLEGRGVMSGAESNVGLGRGVASVLGRLFLATIFLLSAVGNKIPQFSEVSEHMADEGVPAASFMLVGAIVFLLAGSVSLILGFKARIGATLLFVFLVLATYFFHDFWTMEGDAAAGEMIQFMKNLSMMGAMLFIAANGSGAMSLDGKLAGKKGED